MTAWYFIQQRRTQPIYYLSQFFSPGSKIHLGNLWKFISLPRLLLYLLAYTTNQLILITICFREHLRDVEKSDIDASKPVTCHFNLPKTLY